MTRDEIAGKVYVDWVLACMMDARLSVGNGEQEQVFIAGYYYGALAALEWLVPEPEGKAP